jgi:hypothetical protein
LIGSDPPGIILLDGDEDLVSAFEMSVEISHHDSPVQENTPVDNAPVTIQMSFAALFNADPPEKCNTHCPEQAVTTETATPDLLLAPSETVIVSTTSSAEVSRHNAPVQESTPVDNALATIQMSVSARFNPNPPAQDNTNLPEQAATTKTAIQDFLLAPSETIVVSTTSSSFSSGQVGPASTEMVAFSSSLDCSAADLMSESILERDIQDLYECDSVFDSSTEGERNVNISPSTEDALVNVLPEFQRVQNGKRHRAGSNETSRRQRKKYQKTRKTHQSRKQNTKAKDNKKIRCKNTGKNTRL